MPSFMLIIVLQRVNAVVEDFILIGQPYGFINIVLETFKGRERLHVHLLVFTHTALSEVSTCANVRVWNLLTT